MTKTLRTFALVAAIGVVTAGCSLLNNFIPDQTVSNPLGVDGVDATFDGFIFTTALGAQAVTEGTVELNDMPVNDIDVSDVPEWVDPAALETDVGFGATVTLHSATATSDTQFSDEFTLLAASMDGFTIEDGSGSPSVTLPDFTTPSGATVTLSKGECTIGVGVSCDYTATSGLDTFVIAVAIAGANMDTVYEILSTGGSPNLVSGTMTLTVDGSAPSDTTVTVVLQAPNGTLSF